MSEHRVTLTLTFETLAEDDPDTAECVARALETLCNRELTRISREVRLPAIQAAYVERAS